MQKIIGTGKNLEHPKIDRKKALYQKVEILAEKIPNVEKLI